METKNPGSSRYRDEMARWPMVLMKGPLCELSSRRDSELPRESDRENQGCLCRSDVEMDGKDGWLGEINVGGGFRRHRTNI